MCFPCRYDILTAISSGLHVGKFAGLSLKLIFGFQSQQVATQTPSILFRDAGTVREETLQGKSCPVRTTAGCLNPLSLPDV
jgi:hypothetical protein